MSTSVMEQRPGARFTPEERARRRQTLGASEIAAVAGMHKYVSAMDIYLEKIGEAGDIEPSAFLQEASEWGHRMEEPLAKKYAAVHGVNLSSSPSIRGRDDWSLASCTPDRLVFPDGLAQVVSDLTRCDPWPLRGLEIKNRSEYLLSNFGENGTDEVPDDIAMQCHYSLGIVRQSIPKMDHWDVAALIGGNKFRWFRLHYDAGLSDGLLELGRNFMVDNVGARVAPELGASEHTRQWLQQKFRMYSEVMVEATEEIHQLMLDRVAVTQEIKALERKKEYIDTELTQFIGHNTGVQGPNWYATWKAQQGNVSYKAVCEELGATPEQLNAHRGEPARKLFVNANKLK